MTTNTNISVNLENLSDSERQTLMDLITKANTPKSNVWEPDNGATYWYLCGDGEALVSYWRNACKGDIHRMSIGNVFRTEEDAMFAVERLKVLHELRELCDLTPKKAFKPDNTFYQIYINDNKKVNPMPRGCVMCNMYCFSTKEAAQAAIDKIGENRLKKYYFCIPDDAE